MKNAKEEILDLIEKRELDLALFKINELKINSKTDTDLLFMEAECFTGKQEFGKCINLYNEILTLDAGNEFALAKKEQIQTILKFTNLDIYANPNLNLDPWD